MPRKVERESFIRRPALTEQDFPGDVAVFTVKEAQDNIRVQKPDGRIRYSTRLVFAELEGFNYWPNATSVNYLRRALGANAERWAGKKVVLEKVETETPDGVPVIVVWVAEPPTWKAHIAAASAAQA